MRLSFVMLFTLSVLVYHQVHAQSQQFVDIGFRGADKFIAIELLTSDGQEALKFTLASTVNPGKAVALSACAYPQQDLEREVSRIEDAQVRSDFKWIFVRSNYSSRPLDLFYPQFRALLERSRPDCPVQDLQKIIDQLESQKG